MKEILLISATFQETEPLLSKLEKQADSSYILDDSLRITHLVCGVGMVAAAVNIALHLAHNKYDMAIMAGICGSFHKNIPLGTLVRIVSEQMPELGAEAGDAFISIEQMNLMDMNQKPYRNGIIPDLISDIPSVLTAIHTANGITVNKVNGNEKNIHALVQRIGPDVESMEGAAMHYACIMADQQFVHVRCISNYVVKRNRDDWDIPLAIKNLNDFLYLLLKDIS